MRARGNRGKKSRFDREIFLKSSVGKGEARAKAEAEGLEMDAKPQRESGSLERSEGAKPLRDSKRCENWNREMAVIDYRFSADEARLEIRKRSISPNQALEPTTLLVMPRACARVTPSSVVAHL
jgi:hypothetical protein